MNTNEQASVIAPSTATFDKANDVSAFCSKDKLRQILHGIHFAKHCTEATDGSICVSVPYVVGALKERL